MNPSYEFPSHEGALSTLKSLGWKPSACIDVGAYHGEWALMLLSIYPDAQVLMIEGQERKRKRLHRLVESKPANLAFEIALLGAADGREVVFTEMETGSSVFEERSPYPRSKCRRTLTRLDTLLTNHEGFQASQLLKIDTQGYELEVLQGAQRLLERHVELVLLEVSLVPINMGAPLFCEVVDFMSRHGFSLFDICSMIRRRDGVLWQCDLLFVRHGTALGLDAELTAANWGG